MILQANVRFERFLLDQIFFLLHGALGLHLGFADLALLVFDGDLGI
jgi:hypothetical protein